jgi:ketosteroid isomerase-like protein
VGADVAQIEQFLLAYADALAAGDGERVADMWELPALVMSDAGTRLVTERAEVVAFFGQAAEQYRSSGITTTRPEHLAVEHLGERISSADVRWVGVDPDGRVTPYRELSTYLLRTGDDGRIRIQVALARPSRLPAD